MNDRAILATDDGWLIAVTILKETPEYYHVVDLDDVNYFVEKYDNNSSKLFDSVYEAEDWINNMPSQSGIVSFKQ